MSYVGRNFKSKLVADGTVFPIPAGFLYAVVSPVSGSTFTITDSTGEVSPTFPVEKTFPSNQDLSGYPTHVITSVSGDVHVSYVI